MIADPDVIMFEIRDQWGPSLPQSFISILIADTRCLGKIKPSNSGIRESGYNL